MTDLLPTSDRAPAARRFGLELKRAVKARGTSQRRLAADLGLNRGRIANWAAGTASPTVEMAERMADVLMWPRLTDLARAGRELLCVACGRTFVAEGQGPQRYCSLDCRRFQNQKRVPGRRDLTRVVLERRTDRYRAAVAAMCAACEPSGLCRTAACPLQVHGVSPLPLAGGAIG